MWHRAGSSQKVLGPPGIGLFTDLLLQKWQCVSWLGTAGKQVANEGKYHTDLLLGADWGGGHNHESRSSRDKTWMSDGLLPNYVELYFPLVPTEELFNKGSKKNSIRKRTLEVFVKTERPTIQCLPQM